MDVKDAYASYPDLATHPYKLITHLMDNSEIVWKLLRYDDPDAWSKPNLTKAEKGALIYPGGENITDYRVFTDQGQSDVFTAENCVIRMGIHSIFQENRTVGTIYYVLEAFAHYKVNHLSNYTNRVDVITSEFIRVFNGATLMGIGQMNMDRASNHNARMELGFTQPHRGRWLIMGVKSG